jgi:dienelactone hydrolase
MMAVIAGGMILAGYARETVATPWRPNEATNAVAVSRAEWRDEKRDRVVPVKIYAPQVGNGPFPVIIFSHGLGGSREGYEYFGQCWASHGYISVHLQHEGSDDGVWKDARLGQRMSAMKRAAAQPRNAMNRVQDVSFALDQLTHMNASDPVWRGKLDLARVGVAGHSFGAYTTLASAGANYSALAMGRADARIKAAIPMSAPVPANKQRLDEAYAGVKIPCLHMTGTEDNSPIGDTNAEERRLPFDHCRNSDQFLITFTGGDHAIFGGRERKLGGSKDAVFQRLIGESALAFWDAYLRDDAKAKEWLTVKFKDALGKEGVFEMKLKK